MSLDKPAQNEDVEVSQTANCDHIPVIDLSSLDSPDVEERQKLASLINDACTKVGFFYIKNHGIPEDMIEAVHNAAERFFNLTEAQKMRYYIGNSRKFRGYTPMGAEEATGTEQDLGSEKRPFLKHLTLDTRLRWTWTRVQAIHCQQTLSNCTGITLGPQRK
ncbi:hypothetical protein NXS19_004741 [Fusarium pseudograminearum]|nr:hypothetical protein NXS19_004741 [Fusarium pseudograminearum]